jgi:hypothetical protein
MVVELNIYFRLINQFVMGAKSRLINNFCLDLKSLVSEEAAAIHVDNGRLILRAMV